MYCVNVFACDAQAWFIITYALFIYLLNLLLGFLTPLIEPANYYDEDGDTEGPVLPTRLTDEFRPFQRKLPEFKYPPTHLPTHPPTRFLPVYAHNYAHCRSRTPYEVKLCACNPLKLLFTFLN